jgi:hypothetical protein
MDLTASSLVHRAARLAIAQSDRRAATNTRTPSSSAFDRAIEHFAHGRWLEAFEGLASLADAGDRESARIAMLMTARGPRLFGRAFPASPSRRARWQAIASRVDASGPALE